MALPWRALTNLCRAAFRAVLLKDEEAKETIRFHLDGAEDRFLLAFPADRNAVVVDVGGFVGRWASAICHRYDPFLFAFEPVPAYFQQLEARLGSNPKARLFQYGLGATNRSERMPEKGAATAVRAGTEGPVCSIRSMSEVFEELGLVRVDVIAINIEGGEYELLPHMFERGLHLRCRNILIQFHGNFEPFSSQREAHRKVLEKTHWCTFQYRHFWENWRLREERA